MPGGWHTREQAPFPKAITKRFVIAKGNDGLFAFGKQFLFIPFNWG
jgi:hypothetical protein